MFLKKLDNLMSDLDTRFSNILNIKLYFRGLFGHIGSSDYKED